MNMTPKEKIMKFDELISKYKTKVQLAYPDYVKLGNVELDSEDIIRGV